MTDIVILETPTVATAVTEVEDTTKIVVSETTARGPVGPPGAPGADGIQGVDGADGPVGMVIVQHGADANVARPDTPLVYWIGAVTPVNALPYDFYWDGV